MAALLDIFVSSPDDIIDAYGAGAVVRVSRGITDSVDDAAEIGIFAVVAGTTAYEYPDPDGTVGTDRYFIRYSTASPTVDDDYSDWDGPILAGALDAYAEYADLVSSLSLGEAIPSTRESLLRDLLGDVSEELDGATHRTFLRTPQVSGTETFYLDVPYDKGGRCSLVLAAGDHCTDGRALDIVSVTTLEIRQSEQASYVSIAAGDTGYFLESGYGPGVAGIDWPYEDITLSPRGSYTTWPTGKRAVRIVGVRGFPKVPRAVKRGVLSETAERFRQRIGTGPTEVGVNQFGTPIFQTGSTSEYRTLLWFPYRKGFGVH